MLTKQQLRIQASRYASRYLANIFCIIIFLLISCSLYFPTRLVRWPDCNTRKEWVSLRKWSISVNQVKTTVTFKDADISEESTSLLPMRRRFELACNELRTLWSYEVICHIYSHLSSMCPMYRLAITTCRYASFLELIILSSTSTQPSLFVLVPGTCVYCSQLISVSLRVSLHFKGISAHKAMLLVSSLV